MSPEQEEHLSSTIAAAVVEGFKQSNGNGTPKNITELLWKGAMSFGVPTIVLGVVVAIVYQTAPKYIESNITTQKSLTTNLEKQTENLEQQTENLDQQGENLNKAAKTLDALTQSVAEIADWDSSASAQFQETVYKEHGQCLEDHQMQMEKLTEIESKIAKD